MSIIQEALRKVQGLAHKERKEEKHETRQEDRQDAPKETPRMHSTNNYKGVLALLIALIIIGGYGLRQIYSERRAYAKPRPMPHPTLREIETNIEPKRTAEPVAEAIKGAAGLIKLPPRAPDVALSGIMYLEDGARAIINDAIVGEGDEVSGARVVKITKRSVILDFEGTRFSLDLK